MHAADPSTAPIVGTGLLSKRTVWLAAAWLAAVALIPVRPGTGTSGLVLSFADAPVRLAAIALLAMVWRRRRGSPASRTLGFVLLAAVGAQLATLGFRLKWLFPEWMSSPYPDLAQLLTYLSLAAATASLPRRSVPWRSRLSSALDVVAITGGFGLVVWYYLIRDAGVMAIFGEALGPLIELAYPILDVVMLVAFVGRRPGRGVATRTAHRALLLTVLAYFLADAIFGVTFYVAQLTVLRLVGELGYALATAGFVGIAVAYADPALAAPDEDVLPSPVERFSPLAALAVGAAVIATLLEEVGSGNPVMLVMLTGAGSLALLLLLRQVVTASANEAWMADRQRLLEAEVSARTAELADANARLEALAHEDALTGLVNRRGFDAAIARVWGSAVRGREQVAVLLLDVDAFKLFNDRAGHQAGDACLRSVARLVREAVPRTTDLVARYGGEEFVVLCPHTDASGALALADRIVTAVRAAALPHPASPVGPVVTVSVGAAAVSADASGSVQQLVAAADAALYRAKRDGRDRAVLAADVSAP